MYLFISFVLALMSLYYIGRMADTYDADTTYLTPLLALLIYSIISIIREIKKDDWLYYDDGYYNTTNRYDYGGLYSQPIETTHYPSNKEVREKINKLEKSCWFRFRRGFAAFFGIDITAKYYKPYKTSSKCKVIPINGNKDDYSRFAPKNDRWNSREATEYNEVAKLMGKRSCEISFDKETDTLNDDNTE